MSSLILIVDIYVHLNNANCPRADNALLAGRSCHDMNSIERCDGVDQLLERRPQDPMDSMTRGSNPVRSTRKKLVRVFPSQKCCADSLSVCPAPVCILSLKALSAIGTLISSFVRCIYIYIYIYACIRMITYARELSCNPCQSSVDYGNAKKTQYTPY